MILQLPPKEKPKPSSKITWKYLFKYKLYAQNYQSIKTRSRKQNNPTSLQRAINNAAHFISNGVGEKKQFYESPIEHSYYSSYIPITENIKLNDQLVTTFPYIGQLEDKNRAHDKNMIYQQIQTLLGGEDDTRDKNRLENSKKLAQCIKLYLSPCDTIDAIECYVQILKQGTAVLSQLHQKYSSNCKQYIFFHKVLKVEKYFRSDTIQINKFLPISVDSYEQINEYTISKTMKSLFCSVCLLYRCKHALEDIVLQKNFKYLSQKNQIPKSQHIKNAIRMCQIHQHILKKQQKQDGMVERQSSCSQQCFWNLDKIKFENLLNFQRYKLVSPLVKSVMNIGIQLFSFNPCKIKKLFSSDNKISCALVFIYFFQTNLYKRLQLQLFSNQYDYLMAQTQFNSISNTNNPIVKQKKKNQILDNKFKHIQISNCFHYFFNCEPQDIKCSSCHCSKRGFCIPQCLCSANCPIRRKGCSCKHGKDQCRREKCICFTQKFQCQPGICLYCFDNDECKRNSCRNDSLIRGRKKIIRVGRSQIAGGGLGAFAGQDIQKDTLVIVYAGEIVQHEIDVMRQGFRRDLSFYNFGSYEGSIDARYLGNKSRFINHGNVGEFNLRAQHMYYQGGQCIVFYSQRDIFKGQELLFDYDGAGDLFKNHRHMYPFIKPKTENK